MSASKVRRGIKEVGRGGVQEHFDTQVWLRGGMTDVFDKGPGAKGRPDRVVTWPAYGFARIHFVELKTIGGRLETWQERDHARRRKLNCHVFVLWTKRQVDDYVAEYGV
jgi:hypothetical protein